MALWYLVLTGQRDVVDNRSCSADRWAMASTAPGTDIVTTHTYTVTHKRPDTLTQHKRRHTDCAKRHPNFPGRTVGQALQTLVPACPGPRRGPAEPGARSLPWGLGRGRFSLWPA